MSTKKCRVCGSTHLQPLIDFGLRPITKRLLTVSADFSTEYVFPIILDICEHCGFVQISHTIPDEELYTEYKLPSSWKPQPHVHAEINHIQQYLNEKDNQHFIIEIGCNDGMFLSELSQAKFDHLLGIEPSRDVAGLAQSRGFNVINVLFSDSVAQEVVEQYGQADCLVSRQVLEHVSALDSFMQGVGRLLKEDGLLMLEVPDFDVPLRYGDVSAIWEEHVNYFTESSLKHLLSQYQFEVFHVERYDFSGGALCIFARKNPNMPVIYHNEYEKNCLFKQNVDAFVTFIKTMIEQEKAIGKKVALYGAGNRAVILLNYFLKQFISVVIDDQPEKQGYYLPQNHLPIVSSMILKEDKNISLCLLAVNSENDHKVMQLHSEFLAHGGQFQSVLSPSIGSFFK